MHYVAIRTILAACALLCLGTTATQATPPVDVTTLPSGGNAVAVDADGNIYVTGTADAHLPGARHPVANASVGADVYVAKLDPTGRLLFETVFGGRYYEEGLSIAVDARGRIYVVGVTNSADFADPNFTNYPTPGEIIWPPSDSIHYSGAFVAVLDPTGSTVLYSQISSQDEESVWATDVAVTPDGRAYYLEMASPWYIPGLGAFTADGGPVSYPQLWMGCWGGKAYMTGLATDPAGNLYVSGTEFLDGGSFGSEALGQAYVEKLDPRGAHLYATCLGTADYLYGNDVAADPAGNAYLTGHATGRNLPVVGALQPEPGGGGDSFIVKLGPTGEVVYSTYLGGSGFDEGLGIAADPSGAVHVTGTTTSSDFPKVRPLPDGCVPRPGNSCRFVARLGPTGEKLDFATLFGRPWLTNIESGGEPVAAGPRGETYLVDRGPLFRFAANRPPDCTAAVVSPAVIWPPDGHMAPVAITGVTDPEGGAVELSITSIFQDEPSTPGTADATGIGAPNVSLRATRSGPGDGRVYHLHFTVADEVGLACTGEVTVCVPHDQGRGRTCGDGGALFASGSGGDLR
ncbi:MAG TPA: SBBP repeat-containing protein [Thermoanaerobaculia bacterium]|nr:SBBP repeat-containing protein [Thermoanaerobaculia bacterium]